MAQFAKLENGIVTNIIVVDDNEADGVAFIKDVLGHDGLWQKADGFVAVDCSYDEENNVYILPQPFSSWTLDEEFMWQPPTAMPLDGFGYYWNEEALAWVKLEIPVAQPEVPTELGSE